MDNFVIPLNGNEQPKTNYEKLYAFLRLGIWEKRFDSPVGIAFLFAVVCVISFLVVKGGVTAGVLLIGALVGIPFIFACMFFFKFGITATITCAFFVLGVKRLVADVQLGVLMDVLVAVMFLGLFIKQIEERDWSFAKNPISKMILIWILYNLLQVANPSAESRLAWVYTVRTFAGIMTLYFLLIYTIDSKEFIKRLIKLWLFLTLLGAIWGYYQEYFGLLPFELAWATNPPERYALLWQAGKFRKFSFFSDPLVYGFLLSFTGLLCFVLMGGPFSKKTKWILGLMGAFMLNGMLFSGTRAAFILPPAGLIFYSLITFKKKVLIGTGVFLFFGVVIINIPTSNANIVRLQSAFNPTNDASYQVRVKNQLFIKPFIQKHPLGGGLGSVGEWGKKFSPWSPLANFPPDSGYIRVATEEGWFGLLLYVTFLFVVFYSGVKDYFRIRDPELKTYALGMLTVFYSLVIANFPQEAIGQYPINILFFVAIAIINKCREMDKNYVAVQVATK